MKGIARSSEQQDCTAIARVSQPALPETACVAQPQPERGPNTPVLFKQASRCIRFGNDRCEKINLAETLASHNPVLLRDQLRAVGLPEKVVRSLVRALLWGPNYARHQDDKSDPRRGGTYDSGSTNDPYLTSTQPVQK